MLKFWLNVTKSTLLKEKTVSVAISGVDCPPCPLPTPLHSWVQLSLSVYQWLPRLASNRPRTNALRCLTSKTLFHSPEVTTVQLPLNVCDVFGMFDVKVWRLLWVNVLTAAFPATTLHQDLSVNSLHYGEQPSLTTVTSCWLRCKIPCLCSLAVSDKADIYIPGRTAL